MDYKNILCEAKEGIAKVTINREAKLNALNGETLRELLQCFSELAVREDIRAAILTGAGSKAFVAGADISEMASMDALQARSFGSLGHSVMNTIQSCPFPVIAAVNGFALGGGSEIALACDFIYASENAKFGLPEVGLGVLPGWGGTQRLTKLIGPGRAKELILSGELINAQTAYEYGIANKVVAPEKLIEEAENTAKKIASKGPFGIKLAKNLIDTAVNVDLRRGLYVEADNFALCFASEDQKEGMKAFLEKRKPEFKGK